MKTSKNFRKPSWFIKGYVDNLVKKTGQYTPVYNDKLVSFPQYIILKRNYLKYNLFRSARSLQDRYMDHPGMTKDEQEKVNEALTLLSEVMDKESWNKNTLYFKQTERL